MVHRYNSTSENLYKGYVFVGSDKHADSITKNDKEFVMNNIANVILVVDNEYDYTIMDRKYMEYCIKEDNIERDELGDPPLTFKGWIEFLIDRGELALIVFKEVV